MKEESLIFIISQPRSGSTYLQRLISNHPKVNTTSEPWILLNFAQQLKPELVTAKFSNFLAKDAFQLYVEKSTELDYQTQLKEFILSLYEPLVRDHSFVIDKTPRYYEMLDEILRFFPGSRVVVLQRNPIEVARSMTKTWGLTSLSQLNAYKRDLLEAPGLIQSFLDRHRDHPGVYSLTYENLVVDTAGELKGIMDWIGLEFDVSQLNLSENDKAKGAFGDPYQNREIQEDRSSSEGFIKSDRFEQFLEGYHHFLGEGYVSKFQINSEIPSSRKTIVFDQFLLMEDISDRGFTDSEERKLQKQKQSLTFALEQIKNSRSYKWGRALTAPLRWLKRKK